MPRVSILTIYFNRESNVEESLKSLLDQDYDDFEVIAVDDGSTDRTLEYLHGFSDSRLRVIRQLNKGFSRTIRDALENLNSEFVAIHGSGDISHFSRISEQVRSLDSDLGAVLCGVASRNLDPVTGSTIDFQRYEKKILTPEDFFSSPPFTHGAVLFRMDRYREVGGYDPRFKYSQDWDLWLRMLSGRYGLFLNTILYDRIQLADGASFNAEKAVEQLKFKHLALTLHEIEGRNRDKFIDDNINSFSLGERILKKMRVDLSARLVKLKLLGMDAQYSKLRLIVFRDYGGSTIPSRAACLFLDLSKKAGFNISGLASFFRKIKKLLN